MAGSPKNFKFLNFKFEIGFGGVAEWSKAHDWKSCVVERLPWVRIPSPPLDIKRKIRQTIFSMLPNFQFLIYNFKSKLNLKFLNLKNSFQISNFKFQIILALSFFLFSTLYFLSSAAFANAASQSSNYPAPNTSPDVPNNLHNWTQTVMIEVMSSLTCQLAGIDPTNPKQSCLGVDPITNKIGFLERSPAPNGAGGAIGFMGNMISTLYTPPLHTSDYFKDLASNFGISKKTYAQNTGGTGFQGLSPLIGIWSAFRNIVYLFLVIIFVVIGLAIMLRIKIDPRTVMSIQNQIPKIIIGILVVTFSFAIAGFLIDLMWVFIYLIFGIFSGIPGVNLDNLNPSNIQGQNALRVASHIKEGGIFGIASNVASSVQDLILNLLGIGTADGIKRGLLAIFTVGISELPYIIPFLIIVITLLIALIRLWFTLIMAYVHILLDVVLAPFWIIGGIVPGSPISLSGWIRDLVANLAAFPVVIAMFMLGKVFMEAFGCDPKIQACKDSLSHNFVPPLIGNPGDPNAIGSLIGLGIILMTPNVVTMLKTALKTPKFEGAGGLGKALAPGLGTPGRVVGGGINYAFGVHYEPVPGGAPGAVQMVSKPGPIGRILRATGIAR